MANRTSYRNEGLLHDERERERERERGTFFPNNTL